MSGSDRQCRISEDSADCDTAIAIIEQGEARPVPQHDASQSSTEQQAERLRQLALELGRSLDA